MYCNYYYCFLGGLIFHYFHNPVPLEMTMDYLIFTYVDDSNEKLTIETFLVLFIFLAVGLTMGIIVLFLEICVHKWIEKKKERQRLANRRPKVAR